MSIIHLTFALSGPARRALRQIESPLEFARIAEIFADKVKHERYRDYAVMPGYFTLPHGYRRARRESLRLPGENLHRTRVALCLKTLNTLRAMERRGLSLTWLVEEVLYFGFRSGMLRISAAEN